MCELERSGHLIRCAGLRRPHGGRAGLRRPHGGRTQWHLQRGVRALVPDGEAAVHLDPIRGNSSGGHGVDGSGSGSGQPAVQIVDELFIQGGFDWFGTQVGDISQPDPERGEHACVRVDEDRGDAEPVCNPTRMLAAGAAEAHQRVRRDGRGPARC